MVAGETQLHFNEASKYFYTYWWYYPDFADEKTANAESVG